MHHRSTTRRRSKVRRVPRTQRIRRRILTTSRRKKGIRSHPRYRRTLLTLTRVHVILKLRYLLIRHPLHRTTNLLTLLRRRTKHITHAAQTPSTTPQLQPHIHDAPTSPYATHSPNAPTHPTTSPHHARPQSAAPTTPTTPPITTTPHDHATYHDHTTTRPPPNHTDDHAPP